MSNQEISSEPNLALNIIKRHAYNSDAKPEVKKRIHAVREPDSRA
jgi:ATP/maltotriose-dependent transcriptional regulator MalT